VRLAEHLHHPKIGRILRLAEYQGTPFVVMEHTAGAFLATIIGSALLLEPEALACVRGLHRAEVANALDYAHQCEDDRGHPLHIIHRAVSPTTIRIGSNGRVKLTNFGAAFSELLGRVPTPPKVLRGISPTRLRRSFAPSPEGQGRSPLHQKHRQQGGHLLARLVLLEMLVGESSARSSGHAAVRGVQARAPTRFRREGRAVGVGFHRGSGGSPPALRSRGCGAHRHKAPAPLKQVVHLALWSNPAERYQSAAELRDELRAYLRSLGQPFGAAEAAAELADILKKASALKRKAAHPVEMGVLPWPKASSIR